eukprot:scaffold31_cov198-Alexandrium_tamarense.AAC.13
MRRQCHKISPAGDRSVDGVRCSLLRAHVSRRVEPTATEKLIHRAMQWCIIDLLSGLAGWRGVSVYHLQWQSTLSRYLCNDFDT